MTLPYETIVAQLVAMNVPRHKAEAQARRELDGERRAGRARAGLEERGTWPGLERLNGRPDEGYEHAYNEQPDRIQNTGEVRHRREGADTDDPTHNATDPQLPPCAALGAAVPADTAARGEAATVTQLHRSVGSGGAGNLGDPAPPVQRRRRRDVRPGDAAPRGILVAELPAQPAPAAVLPLPDPRARMNRTEGLWADHLDTLIVAGELALWRFEEVTLVLGPDCRYTPDFFLLWRTGRVTFDDVKGSHTWDDAKAKIRVAARQFPFFQFRVAQKPKGTTEFTITDIPA